MYNNKYITETATGSFGMDDAPATSGDGYICQTGFVKTQSNSGEEKGCLDNIANYSNGRVVLDHNHNITQNNHSHDFTSGYSGGTSTDTESRPDNYTIRIWKRIN